MNPDVSKILIDEPALQKRISELSQELTRDYAGKDPIIIGILKGAVPFFSDLFRRLDFPCRCDFIGASSYGSGTKSSGMVNIYKDATESLEGQHLIVVEDILDTGTTLSFLIDYLKERNPASIRLCALLDKPSRRNPDITLQADYVGFTIPNEFVIGYGLDFNQYYRNLPYIGVLDPKKYL